VYAVSAIALLALASSVALWLRAPPPETISSLP
jgi:hypothetical protein